MFYTMNAKIKFWLFHDSRAGKSPFNYHGKGILTRFQRIALLRSDSEAGEASCAIGGGEQKVVNRRGETRAAVGSRRETDGGMSIRAVQLHRQE